MSDPKQHLSIIYENKHELSERVFRIVDSGLNHAQDPPSKTTRFISNVEVMPADNEEEVEFRCNLLLCEYRPHGQRGHALPARQLAARCRYRLHKQAGEWRMTQKIVAFLEMDGPLDGMTFLV
jgi:3-phenylpropionate/cinnamic acid dioxygenase small subunit